MQKTPIGKIVHLTGFLGGLAGLSYLLSGKFGLPTGDAAIWLHGGLLLIAFGTYWIEYKFTKPDDVVINGLVGYISISMLSSPPNASWWEILRYLSLALVIVAFLISWHGSPAIPRSNPSLFKRFVYLVIIRLGNATVLFSAIFLLALISYFDLRSAETKWMMIFWIIMVSTRYLEIEELIRWIINLKQGSAVEILGEISGIIEPGIVRFKLAGQMNCSKGTAIVFTRNGVVEEDCPVGVVTGFRYAPDAVEVDALIIAASRREGGLDQRRVVGRLDIADLPASERERCNYNLTQISKLIAITRQGSDISRIYFELVVSPAKLEEGHLVSVKVAESATVFFQVINGKLHEETTFENSERSFVVGEGEQLGTWNPQRRGFETYSWVVRENSPVLRVGQDDALEQPRAGANEISRVEVGQIPNSNFPVHVMINDLVLYHSAILGVTGSGKTFLAYHLIESAARTGIKVICLDATGDYKRYLRDVVLLKNMGAVKRFLDDPGTRIGIVEFIEDKIHPIKTTREITEVGLQWCRDHRTDREITEPVPKVLLVFEEAHTLIPEWNFNPIKSLQDEVSKIAQNVLQARKYGLGFMVVTQRTANVTKSILNQCNSIFAFQAYDETGFEFMKNYMGDHYVRALPNLKRRYGVLVGKTSVSDRPVIVRYHDQDRAVAAEVPPEYPPREGAVAEGEAPIG